MKAKTKSEIKPKVQNIVSAITLDQKIDLKSLAKNVPGIEYNPENFPGAVYRIRELKLAMLIFNSGKLICTGAKSRKDIEAAVENVVKKLRQAHINIRKKPLIEVQNIVASANLGVKVNLDLLAMECENTEYEPEQFPGLVLRMAEPKTVMLVFQSGGLIITGAKNTKDLQTAAEKTKKTIQKYKAILHIKK